MSRYVLSPRAVEDLEEIAASLRTRSPSAEERVLTLLQATIEMLAESPRIGHARRDLADETLRVWTVYRYLIIYRPEERPLQVVRVLHGARDIESIMTR